MKKNVLSFIICKCWEHFILMSALSLMEIFDRQPLVVLDDSARQICENSLSLSLSHSLRRVASALHRQRASRNEAREGGGSNVREDDETKREQSGEGREDRREKGKKDSRLLLTARGSLFLFPCFLKLPMQREQEGAMNGLQSSHTCPSLSWLPLPNQTHMRRSVNTIPQKLILHFCFRKACQHRMPLPLHQWSVANLHASFPLPSSQVCHQSLLHLFGPRP